VCGGEVAGSGTVIGEIRLVGFLGSFEGGVGAEEQGNGNALRLGNRRRCLERAGAPDGDGLRKKI